MPYVPHAPTSENALYQRRHVHKAVFQLIQDKIDSLFEHQFITDPETSEFIESLAVMGECQNVLELGSYSGFTSLHLIRAVYPDGMVTAIDCRPTHDLEFFAKPEINRCFRFINGWILDVLPTLHEQSFDMVFIDSDHSLEHTTREREALWPITKPGTIFVMHDVNKRSTKDATEDGLMYRLVHQWIHEGLFKGAIFQTPHRKDALDAFGEGYSKDLLPHLAVLIRQ